MFLETRETILCIFSPMQGAKNGRTKAQRVELRRGLIDQLLKLAVGRFRINESNGPPVRFVKMRTLRYSKAFLLSSGGRVTSN